VFDIETWRSLECSIFDPAVRRRTIHRKGGGATGRGGSGHQLMPEYDAPPALAVSCTVILCEKHQFLTGNPTFQNNLLHTLFNPSWG